LEQCLNERPEERWPNFREVLERLQQLSSPAAEPPRPTPKTPVPPREDDGSRLRVPFLLSPVQMAVKAIGTLFGKEESRSGSGDAAGGRARKVADVQPAPANVRHLEKKVGEHFYFEVTGDPNGFLWGTDVYTSDSSPATAAVHAGILRAGEKGVV